MSEEIISSGINGASSIYTSLKWCWWVDATSSLSKVQGKERRPMGVAHQHQLDEGRWQRGRRAWVGKACLETYAGFGAPVLAAGFVYGRWKASSMQNPRGILVASAI